MYLEHGEQNELTCIVAAGDNSYLRIVYFDDTLAPMADAMLPEFVVRDEVLIELYPFIPGHISNAHGDAERSMMMHELS